MRKEYKRPTVTVILLEIESIMTTASSEQGSASVGDKPVGGNTPDLSSSRRDVWGNLW